MSDRHTPDAGDDDTDACCDYAGCGKPLAPDRVDDGHTMRFCVEHDAEFAACAKAPDAARQMLRFWVKAQGGAKAAARRMMGGEEVTDGD